MITKVVFQHIGERQDYDIPEEKSFEGLEMQPYIDLPIGTILMSSVDREGYDMARFDIELIIVSVSDSMNIINADRTRFYQTKLVKANGKICTDV